eukprot:SAG11_NODE_6814_length_1242_cov_2.073491_2_plen_109_part_00
MALREQGEHAASVSKLEEAVAMQRAVAGDEAAQTQSIATTLHAIGVALREQGEHAAAASSWRRRQRCSGRWWGTSRSCCDTGITYALATNYRGNDGPSSRRMPIGIIE